MSETKRTRRSIILLRAACSQVSFTPTLSSSKLAAIRSMGMGTLNKLVLRFSNVFWDQVDFLGHAGKDRRKWLLFMDMSRVTNRPILVAMSGGPFAVLMERLGDAEITRRAMDIIRCIYPGAPDPVSSQATRWKTSKFSRGSFSFIPPGCRSDSSRSMHNTVEGAMTCYRFNLHRLAPANMWYNQVCSPLIAYNPPPSLLSHAQLQRVRRPRRACVRSPR